ncbi:fungal specific transcription factor domain-containing protein [Aspergillus puulaauensis]|uniref:Fungal-specific transcription factor domain-containing protein n=1 Tax=Aspergillus puulaauensis TaxID=1220207 RepID=A0A7R8AKM0_9EURO|nr:uncharacterized protein APUU_31214S [Aspergillus puulaauensis]BCS22989.1 hypothetical protein APUU_31214S [Aspergillus puulaauensis]
MSYFERIICSSSTLVDNAHCNPYRYLILPMALASDGLYHATLAIAANTLRLSNPLYRLPALEHHHHALAYLRGLLDQDQWTDRELDEMTGLVLMLCWFEISDNSCSSWVTHLNGYQDLLRARQHRQAMTSQCRSPHSEQLSSFFNRYFAFHLVLARTAFRLDDSVFALQPMLGLMHESDANKLEENEADIIDPYMGLSHSLLLLINQVAQIAWEDRDGGSVGDDSNNVLQLKERLENLQQIPPPLGNDAEAETECVAIAEANRLGALLLLHEVCSRKDTKNERGARHLPRHLQMLDSGEKDHGVKSILSLILEKKASMMRTAVLPLWPLFLAGCCAPTDAERVIVMQLFEELEGIRRFGNIAPAMEVVQMVWRQRDLAAQDGRKKRSDRGGQARFEWERAMAMLGGWKLSLT